MIINPLYVLHPGPVDSAHDADTHFIPADVLCRLYKVPRDRCIITGEENTHCSAAQIPHLIHLYPRKDGDYRLPGEQSASVIANERLQALKRCTFPVGHPHKSFVRNLTVGQTMSERQMHYIEILAWRYRRQIPARLRPRQKPTDLPSQAKEPQIKKSFHEVDDE